MEGMPRVPMFAPELKAPDKPLSPSFADKIREYIVVNYQDDPAKYNEAFNEIESMRNVVMRCSADVESICVMKRYYVQLLTMKKRFPMEENDPLAVPFAWVDRTMDLAPSVTYEDINFEMCCVLFNIGAAHAIIAAKETRSDSDASWPMQHLREESTCMQYTILDFEPAFLNFYSTCFLAQAQECMLEKSIVDKRKPIVITKIAVKIKELYEKNLEYFKNSNACAADLLSTSKHKSWLRLFSAKYELYTALASFYSGVQAENDEKMGLRLSYFIHALDAINRARKIVEKDARESLREAVDFARDVIQQKKDVAQRENDFIYHERVIKPEDFEPVEGVLMVKPVAFDQYDMSVGGEDLFSSILPTDVLKTVSLYSEEKLKFKRDIFDLVEKKDAELESFLVSLQLDQLHLDEPIESVRLPDELLSSSAAFSSQPDAFPMLMNKFNQVMTMASDVEQKLLRLTDRVKDVETEELSKDEGFNVIKAKIEELHSHHKIARENNAELQRAVAAHSENLKLLAMPLSQLSKEICGDYVNPMEHAEGKQLQKVLNKVDEMRCQRFQLVSTLNADIDADDITKKALSERDYDSKDLFERELTKHKKTTDLINQNMVAQDNIIKALTEANANFAEFRRHIMKSNEKRALHSLTLVTAYQVFKDVVEKTDKALQFYKQSLSLVDALSKGVSIIEETEEKRLIDKKHEEADRRAAIESAETLKEFSISPTSLATVLNNTSDGATNGTENIAAKPNRPRLGDYMEYYRSKTRAAEGAEFAGGIAPMKPLTSLLQPTAYPSPVGTFPIQPSTQQEPPLVPHASLLPSNQPQPVSNLQTPQSQQHTQHYLSTMMYQQQQLPQNTVVSSSAHHHQPLQQQQEPAALPRIVNPTTPGGTFLMSSFHLPSASSSQQQPVYNNSCFTIAGGGQEQHFAPPHCLRSSANDARPPQPPAVNLYQPCNVALNGCYGVEQQFTQFTSLSAASVVSSSASGSIVSGTSTAGCYNTLPSVASAPQQLSTCAPLNNAIMSSPQSTVFTLRNSSGMTTLPQQHQQPVSYCPSKSVVYGTVSGGAALVPSTTEVFLLPQQSSACANCNVNQNLVTSAVNTYQSLSSQQQYPSSGVMHLPPTSLTLAPAHSQQFGGLGSGAKSPWHQNLPTVNPYASSASFGPQSTNPWALIYSPRIISGSSGTTNVQPFVAPNSTNHQQTFANASPFIAGINNSGGVMNQNGLQAFNGADLLNQHHNQLSSGYQNAPFPGGVSAATTLPTASINAAVVQQQFHTKAASTTTTSGNSGALTSIKANENCQLPQGFQQVQAQTAVKPQALTLLDEFDGLLIGNSALLPPVVSDSTLSQQPQQQLPQQLRPAATVLPVARPPPAAQQQQTGDSDLAIIGVTSLSHPSGADVVTTVSATRPCDGDGLTPCCRGDDKNGASDTVMTAVVPDVNTKIIDAGNDGAVVDLTDNHKQSTVTKNPSDDIANVDEDIGVTKHRHHSHIEALLDPAQFDLGECDRTRLEKRMMREEFRRNGLNAQLPKPDASDPLNELDPHFWLTK